jgi:hypothetical protein
MTPWQSLSAIVLVLTVQAPTHPPGAAGSLCILPHVRLADAHTGSPDMPPPAEKYTLRLDGGRWVALSPESRILLVEIPLAGRHRVAIRGDGRPWAAFTFAFKDSTPTLCLYQNDLYLWWQLAIPRESFAACRCSGVESTPWQPPSSKEQ